MPERGSPNLARRQRLGKELRRLRERTTSMTGDEATTQAGLGLELQAESHRTRSDGGETS